MLLILILCGWMLLLIGLQELLRRTPPWLFGVLFLVVPVISIPRYLESPYQSDWFPWLKLGTILICLNWLAAIRTGKLDRLPWVGWSVYVLLSVNIVEAMVRDGEGATWANLMSLFTGGLVILTLRVSAHPIQLHGPQRELLFSPTTRWWIAEYTLWNWAFVYLNFPEISGHQLAVLLAAAIPAMWHPARWLQARATTLGISTMTLATFPDLMIPMMDTSTWSTPTRRLIVAIVSVSLAISYAARLASKTKHTASLDSQDQTDSADAPSRADHRP